MYNFRTDLASERRDIYKKANKLENEIDGIKRWKYKNRKSKNSKWKRRKSNWKANWKLYYNRHKKIKNSTEKMKYRKHQKH